MDKRERGSSSIELAIITPAIIAVFVTFFIAGRQVIADQSVEAAAFDAARTASLATNEASAFAEANAAARDSLAAQSIICLNLNVDVNTHEFAKPVGEPANVVVTIECDVRFSDVVLPGMPGTSHVKATFTSPLDQYRSRS
jgi:Flp pilus assembly protein TadG